MLRVERERIGMSGFELACRSRVTQPIITWIEQGRYIPYECQLQRIADALGYEGDAEELLRPAPEDMRNPSGMETPRMPDYTAFNSLPWAIHPANRKVARNVRELLNLAYGDDFGDD